MQCHGHEGCAGGTFVYNGNNKGQAAGHAAADDILVVRPLAPVRDRRLEPALALVVAVVHERPPSAALMPVALAAALGPLVDVSALPQVDPVAVLVVRGSAKIRPKGGRWRRGGERQAAGHAAADDILVVRPLAPVRDRRLEP